MQVLATWLGIVALGSSIGIIAARSQDPGAPARGQLKRAPAQDVPLGEPEDGRFDREHWRSELEAADLERRERAFEALLGEARGPGGEGAREALREWAGGQDELAWTSRLALRELERGRSGIAGAPGSPWIRSPWHLGQLPFGGMTGHDLIEELQRRMDQMLGASPFGGSHSLQHGPQTPGVPGVGGSQSLHAQSFQLESGPDGVRVRIEEEHGGDTETKEYEAESMEELLRLYPELRDRIGIAQGTPPGFDFETLFEGLGLQPERSRPGLVPQAPEHPIPTHVLGVYVTPRGTGEDEARRGLLVDRIEPGTIAQALGLRRGDLLLELNDVALTSASDLSRALEERAAEEDVRVTFIDRRGERRTLTWKPPR